MKPLLLAVPGAVCAVALTFLGAGCATPHEEAEPKPPTGLAMTPQMGWNSWNKFAGRVNEQVIRETADAMATNGMKAAGYIYVNIDDTWEARQRDPQGNILADPTKFPSGLKALADYIHAKGLKFGIYSDAGGKTCGGFPASRDHEAQDALSYASWGVDYLSPDWCDTAGLQAPAAYKKMSDALKASGRPILFSMCEWGGSKPWLWGNGVGQSWRTTGDIYANFDQIKRNRGYNDYSVMDILDLEVKNGVRKYAGPGHWNDPDMLEVGNGMSESEDRAHFTLWCMLCAPLISGNDQRHMKAATLKILTDKDIIALNQDPLGIEAFRYSAKDGVEVWFKPLSHGAWAMCVLNRNKEPKPFTFDWKNEKVADDIFMKETKFDATTYRLRDLWKKQDMGTTKTVLTAEVPGHDVLTLRLEKK